MKVKVYSSPFCVFCGMAEDFLKEHNIKFEYFDVSKDMNAMKEMIKKSGQNGVPVIIIDGKIIVGFDEEAIKKELKL